MLSAVAHRRDLDAAIARTFRLDCGRLDEEPAMRCVLLAAAFCLALPAAATDVSVRVRDAQGKPVADAVVTLEDGGARAAAAPQAHTVDQRDENFVPYVVVARPGDRVVFKNSDSTRHHVYSFSAAKAFEQLLAPGDTGAPLVLDRTGLVAVGCNIHDHMRAWLVVTDAPRVAMTGADGIARFGEVGAGSWRSVVWHPHLRPRQPPVAQALVLREGEARRELGVSLRLLPDPRDADPHRSHY
jgi:plastocyanin